MTTAKRLDPQNPQNYDRWAGQAQFLLGRFEDAALTLRQVIELDPEDLWSHMWLGVAYAELGREEKGWSEIVRLDAMRKERSGVGPISQSVVRSFDLHPPDMNKLQDGLVLAGVTAAFAPPTRRGDRLKGEELRAFSRLPWWYGNSAGKGREYWSFTNPQGEVVHGGRWRFITFSPRILPIDNDQICFADSRFGGKPCYVIHHNPEGTRENNDEYIILFLHRPFAFYMETFISAYEERPPALEGKPLKEE